MDEFRRQLQQLGERIRDWVSDLTSRLSGAATDARAAAEERRRRSRERSEQTGGDPDGPRTTERASRAGRRAASGVAGAASRLRPRSAESVAAREFAEAAVVVATGEDDVASVVGRIDTAESPEVVLIVRRDARALRRATAWPHIAAHVRRRGIELGVVAPRSDVRAHARTNGLRVARTPGGLKPHVEYLELGGRRVVVPPVPWGRIVKGSMILVALSTIFFMACYRVPSARITIVPPSEPVSAEGMARANALIDANDTTTQVIQATTVRRQVFTAVTTTTSGEVEVGDQHAILQVTFANAGGDEINVPRGTRLATEDGIVFLTDEDVGVPPEGQATVSATAEFPGVPGNVPSGGLVRIDSELPGEVTLAGSTAGSGGTNRLTAGVSQADVDRVRDIAGGVLDRIALATLQAFVEDEDLGTLLSASVSAAIFSEQPLQQLEEPSDIFVVEYTITASGLVVTHAAARSYGELLIRDQLASGVALIPGSVEAQVVPAGDQGEVQVTANGRSATLQNIAVAANEITGMRPQAAKDLLQAELRLDEPPTIDIRPNFVPWLWLPRRAESIEVVIAGPPPPEGAEDGGEDAEGEDGPEGGSDGGSEGEGEAPTVTPTEAAATGG